MTLPITMQQKLSIWLTNRFYRWLDKRQPASAEVRLNQQLLFVFPSAFGGWLVVLIGLLYLFGTNYQNNLILLCAYLLLSLFCCCILAAFFNLYQLHLSTTATPFCYSGSALQVVIKPGQHQHKKMLSFSSQDFAPVLFETLPDLLQFELHPQKRGLYQLRRFKLESYYPFGLIRCWTHIQLAQSYWVYPAPASLLQTQLFSLSQQKDHPDQLAPYHAGAPASAIDWKRLAKNPWQPVIRHYSASTAEQPLQNLVVTATGAALEQQLSEFCALLLQFEQQGQIYGLSTPKGDIDPDHGQAHLHRCLQALALC